MRVDFSQFGANQVLFRNVRRFFINIWDHPNPLLICFSLFYDVVESILIHFSVIGLIFLYCLRGLDVVLFANFYKINQL